TAQRALERAITATTLPGLRGPIKDLVLERSAPIPVSGGSATAGRYTVSVDLGSRLKGRMAEAFYNRGTINGHSTRLFVVLTSSQFSSKWDPDQILIYDPEYIP